MEPLVSICCTVYNHEKYLRQCLDSLLSQKTSFPYEIIIHDDASTDNSKQIIEQYRSIYPEIIVFVSQTENKYSQGIRIYKEYIYPLVRGKYIAYCEGDDFWSDENKLQMQYEVLEKKELCNLCVHRVSYVNEDGSLMTAKAPSSNKLFTGEYSDSTIMDYIGDFFHLSSFFARVDMIRKYSNQSLKFRSVANVGDKPLFLYFTTVGNIYYIDKELSCYRQNSLNSWTQRLIRGGNKSIINQLNATIRMYKEFDKYSQGKYSRFCNREIERIEYRIAKKSYPYRSCFDYKYRAFLRKETSKSKIKMILLALLPDIYHIIIEK